MNPKRPARVSSPRKRRGRRGFATLWLLVLVPVLVIFLCAVVDLSNVWLARVELETSLEAAALAGAKAWGDGGSTSDARLAAQDYAEANTVIGNPVLLAANEQIGRPNDNDLCDGNIVLGGVTGTAPSFTFDTDANPSNVGGDPDFGVRAQAQKSVASLCGSVFGSTFGPYKVSAQAEARFNKSNSRPELIRVTTFLCTP